MTAARLATWPPPDAPVLDPSAITLLRELEGPEDPELARVTVAVFLTDGIRRIGELRAAVAEGRLDAARRTAHALKGSALVLGTVRLARACAGLEEAATAGQAPDAGAWLGRAAEEFAAAKLALVEVMPGALA